MHKKPIFCNFITLFLVAITFSINAQEGRVTIEQDTTINRLLEYKKDLRTLSLYKIQICSGNRTLAEKTRNKFINNYSGYPCVLKYDTPNYKVWVGRFRNRLDADRTLATIKKHFRDAFVVYSKSSY